MLAAVRSRQPWTGTRKRVVGSSASSAERARNASDSRAGAAPAPPTWRRSRTGSASAVLALPSPEAPCTGMPDLSTSSGRTPKKCGCQSTTSASLPRLERADVRREAVRDGGVDRDLREVAQHALVVGRARLGSAQRAHRRGVLERAPHDLADAAHALRVAREHRDHAEVVQEPFRGHRLRTHAVAHDRRVAVHASRGEHVHGRHHRQVLGRGVHPERHRRRRRGA